MISLRPGQMTLIPGLRMSIPQGPGAEAAQQPQPRGQPGMRSPLHLRQRLQSCLTMNERLGTMAADRYLYSGSLNSIATG